MPAPPTASALIPPYSAGTLGTSSCLYLQAQVADHMYFSPPTGPYWQQPGRSIVESLLVPFPFPAPSSRPKFSPTSFHRSFFSDALPELPSDPAPSYTTSLDPVLLTHTWTMAELAAYLGTFSAAHTYDEKHGKGSDVAQDFSVRLQEALKSEGVPDGAKVRVAWRMGTVEGKMQA